MKLRTVLLFPLSLKYAYVVLFRNKFYDWGLFKSHSFKTPSICVGNISLGGTGKTPMIDLLINHYQNKKIVVLSRGYGRKTKGLIHANINSTAQEIGDEPKQLLDAHPSIDMVVAEKRVQGMNYIEDQIKPDLILLDDAFQHRSVKAKVNVLLTIFSKPYFKDYYFPLGSLRDHKISTARADVILVTKSPYDLSSSQKSDFAIQFKQYKPVFFSHIAYSEQLLGTDDALLLEDLHGKKVHLVTGIAKAKLLVDYLKSRGIKFSHFNYKDHHNYSDKDINTFSKGAQLILTTEKDYTKLKGRCKDLYYLPIKHQIDGQESFFEALDQLVFN